MSVKPPRIECTRCQKPATAKDPKCPSCGSRLVKVCGQCGFKNSVAKNYCDSCGAPQTDEAVSAAKSPVAGTQPQTARPAASPPAKLPEKKSATAPPPQPAKAPEAKPPEPKPAAAPPPQPAKVVVPALAEPPEPKPAAAPPQQAKLPEPKPAAAPPPQQAKPLELKPAATPPPRAEDTDPKADPLRTHPQSKSEAKPPSAAPPQPLGPSSRVELPKTQIARAPEPGPLRPPPPAMAPRRVERPEDLRIATPASPPVAAAASRRVQLPAALLLALLLSLLWFGFTKWQATAPQRTLLRTAEDYLAALRSRDLGKAYSMISTEARGAVTLGEYQASQDTADWSFGDVAIYQLKPDWATVRYKLTVADQPAKDDWLSFVREGRTWRRAYWWPLSAKIEEALERGSAEEALSLARLAVRIDPRDALAQSYVCEADYGRADFAAAEKDCLEVLELNKFYPSEIDQAALRQVHSILGDAYKNYLGKPADAAREFESLLTFPGITPLERCDAYVAHAESRYLARDYDGSMVTLRSCSVLCSQADQRSFCERNLKILSGQAGAEAVAVAKSYPMNEDLTLFEWRKDISDEALKKIDNYAERADFSRTDETWLASHLAGALYKVSVLSRKGQEAVTAEVNLWTHSVKVDFHVR